MARNYTSPGKLLVEAAVVAVAFLVLFFAIHAVAMHFFKERAMKDHGLLAAQVALAAAGFHVIAEYTSLNAWYCRQREP